jgi:hypothetical protein
MILEQIYPNILNFLGITFTTDAVWIVMPLLIATLMMMIYFGIYNQERADWGTNFSNSLVLIFVSLSLFQYIYGLNDFGELNFFVYHWDKTLAALFLLSIGLFLVRFNFEHLLPMKFATYLSSPLTINSFAYALILFVYSKEVFTWTSLFALLIIILILIGIFLIIKIPAKKLSSYIEKEKEKDRVNNLKETEFHIKELEGELKLRKKDLINIKINQIDKEKKEAAKLNKIFRKSK